MPGHSKRDRLLEAGMRLLLGSRPGDALRGMSAQAVAAAAGTSRQTFYSHWQAIDAYMTAILDETITDVTVVEQLVPVLSGLWADDPRRPPEDVIRETCDLDFKLWCQSPAFRIQHLFGFWSRTCPDVASRLRQHYRMADAALIPAYDRALEVWGRELVPEFDMTEIAVVFSALIDGLVIR